MCRKQITFPIVTITHGGAHSFYSLLATVLNTKPFQSDSPNKPANLRWRLARRTRKT
ncbi:MAG: hypothetical protein ACRCUY_09835 [Thermoguttaceae bacterium]